MTPTTSGAGSVPLEPPIRSGESSDDSDTTTDDPDQMTTAGHPSDFTSLLFPGGLAEELGPGPADASYATDLNLDQVIASIAGKHEERDLIISLLYHQIHDPATIRFRHEVFADLDNETLFRQVTNAVNLLHRVRSHLAQLENMQSSYQREGWFLDAAAIYCEGVTSLANDLSADSVKSEGLLAFGNFLSSYTSSDAFTSLAAETAARKASLSQIRYCVRIRGNRVDVSRYDNEPDYSDEVLRTFERFKQGAVKDYLIHYRNWPGMNHVGAQILDLVARLFPEEFSALDDYCRRYENFFDATVRCFERDVQFYLAYLEYLAPLRAAGLNFCYPEMNRSKQVFATETFDVALANKLVAERRTVVTNDFALSGPERILVISGPNQGGKTTFARVFGQLHHLGSIGVPVAGTAARLFLFDRLFTHFEREDNLTNMTGKLEDDLVRIREALMAATPSSIVIMNELFSSTALRDARYLGKKVLEKIIELDLLAVYVTFVDELASLSPSIVSMVSTIVPDNPADRTFKVVRGPADGLAYALAIAEKYDLTYERLRERLIQ